MFVALMIMDLQFSSYPILFTFFVLVLIVIGEAKRSKAKGPSPKLPPGPWKLPLIGNVHQLVGSLPHHSLRNLALKYGPLMHLQLGQVSTIVVSSPEVAKEVMKTHDNIFAHRPYLLAANIMTYDRSGISFSPCNSYWRQIRKICAMELLSAKRVQSFRYIREEEVSNLIRRITLDARSCINLSEKIFSFTSGVISRAALGNKWKDHEALMTFVAETVKLAAGFCVADLYPSVDMLSVISGLKPKLQKLHQEVDRMLENIVDVHKTKETTTKAGNETAEEDLVDVLLKLQKHGELEFPLTGNNIKAIILEIFGGGGETASATVEWAMAEMLKKPEVMRKAQDEVRQVFHVKGNVDEASLRELNYLKSVIKETLRLHPPAPLLIPRECREKCEINGYEIPAKTKVVVNAWAIGRDPRFWIDAERFYPERFLDSPIDYKGAHLEFIPFGAGRRICPGISFAAASMELLLAQLLYHFDWKLPNGMKQKDLDMTEIYC